MKKIAIVASILLVVIAVGGLIFLFPNSKTSLTAERLLPSGALSYMRVDHLKQNMEDFMNSEFVETFKQVDFEKAMRQAGAQEKEILFYRMISEQVTNKNNMEILSKLFGKELVIAFYPGRDLKGASSGEKLMAWVSNTFFITRLDPGVRFIEILTAALAKFSPDVAEKVVEYHGKEIRLINVKGFFVSIGYVRFGDFLVFGVGDAAAKRAIDTAKDEGLSLAKDAVFLKTLDHRIDGAEQAGFFNYGLFMEQMKDALLEAYQKSAKVDTVSLEQLEEGFRDAEGFEVFSFSIKYDKLSSGRFDLSFNPQDLSDQIKRFYKFSLQRQQSLSFVPQDALAYSWSAMMTPEFYWHSLQQLQKSASQAKNVPLPSPGETIFGFDPQDILSLLTGDVGWFLSDVDFEKIPLPKGVFFLGLNNKDQAMVFIDQAVAKIGFLRLETEDYQGVNVGSLGNIPFFSNLEPAYCIMNNYLLISPQKVMLQRAIDVASGKDQSLAKKDIFLNEEYGLSQPGNAVIFLDVVRLVEVGQRVLDWANEWADVQYKRHQSFKAGVEQRLEDVNNKIVEKQKELDALEAKLVEKQKQKEIVSLDPGELEGITKELEEKSKLFAASQESLQELKDEQFQLVNAQAAGNQRVTDTGMKRLAQLKEQIPKRQDRVDHLKQEIDQLTARKDELEQSGDIKQELSSAIDENEMIFKEVRGKMKALEEIRTGLQATLQQYEKANLPTPEQRKAVLDKVIHPVLDAFSHVSWVGGKTLIMQDRIRSEFFMEGE